MTNELDTAGESRGDRERTRAYLREFLAAIGGYVLVLVVVLLWGGVGGHSAWRFVWAVLPAVPAAGVVWAVVRHVRRIDDYQRRVLLEGLAVGFALAMRALPTYARVGVTVELIG